MPRDLPHFELPVWQEPLPRRRNAGRGAKRSDRETHSRELVQQADALAQRLATRSVTSPPHINPKLIFKLRLRAGALEDAELERMRLHVLSRDAADEAVVVFPDDATLAEFRGYLRQYAQMGDKPRIYAFLDAVEDLLELGPDDRMGRRLQSQPLTDDETAVVDIEFWHPGDPGVGRRFQAEITALLSESGSSITDRWTGDAIMLARARVNREALDALLSVDYVKEVDRPPAPSFEMGDIVRLETAMLNVASVPDGLVGVLVVDSGVMQLHPLLGPALGDAQVFPDPASQSVTGGADDGDRETGGHGTAVAGIAVYGDVGACIEGRRFVASARLFSARVTDDQNNYDEKELLEHQLERAVGYFLANYPEIKVINISLGDSRLVSCAGQRYQFRFAAAVDELAYRYRDRNVLFVISAGNLDLSQLGLSAEEVYQQYPDYSSVSDPDRMRVIDPATSALALTVGGLSYGVGLPIQNRDDLNRVIAGNKGWPSPFTRRGWGFKEAVKPELVDFAGALRFERGVIRDTRHAMHEGVPTTARNFGPPDGRLLRTVVGTSFAAPRVANAAAQLFNAFPDASSNLVRALLAAAADVPDDRPPSLSRVDPCDERILRLYGYGQCDLPRAFSSAENDILFLADVTMEIGEGGQFQIFLVPPLPAEFLDTNGKGAISVCLAYDPQTRHTRANEYLGVRMDFHLFRNLHPSAVADHMRVWLKKEKEAAAIMRPQGISAFAAGERVDLRPGRDLRSKGTLQKGTAVISGRRWHYDDGPLWLAVTCYRSSWLPADITEQRYAVVVSLRHEDSAVNLHAHARNHARVLQRARIMV